MYNNNDIYIISEGIAIIILTIIGHSLETYLNAGELLETVPTKITRSFTLYLTGLILVKKDSSCAKMAAELGSVSHDKLNRIIAEGKVMINKISAIFINFCLSQKEGGFSDIR